MTYNVKGALLIRLIATIDAATAGTCEQISVTQLSDESLVADVDFGYGTSSRHYRWNEDGWTPASPEVTPPTAFTVPLSDTGFATVIRRSPWEWLLVADGMPLASAAADGLTLNRAPLFSAVSENDVLMVDSGRIYWLRSWEDAGSRAEWKSTSIARYGEIATWHEAIGFDAVAVGRTGRRGELRGIGVKLDDNKVRKSRLAARPVLRVVTTHSGEREYALCTVGGPDGSVVSLARCFAPIFETASSDFPVLHDPILDLAPIGVGRWLLVGMKGAYTIDIESGYRPATVAEWAEPAHDCSPFGYAGSQLTRMIQDGDDWVIHLGRDWRERVRPPQP